MPNSRSDFRDLPFVFIIGMNKTGTTALHEFFAAHGWPSVHFDKGRLAKAMLSNVLRGRRVLTGYDRSYRVFSDMVLNTMDFTFEANSLFPALDRQYPGAFFVLNTRDESSWIESRKNKYFARFQLSYVDFERRVNGLQDEDDVIRKWQMERRAFEGRVQRYFEGNPKFLTLDIAKDDVPKRLGELLGVDFDPTKWKRITTNPDRGGSMR